MDNILFTPCLKDSLSNLSHTPLSIVKGMGNKSPQNTARTHKNIPSLTCFFDEFRENQNET